MGDEAPMPPGVISLESPHEGAHHRKREREEFVIEATHLMRDRLLMHQVFDRLGWEQSVWIPWMQQTPFMQGFRQMLFSKVVPNLKRLGLLTPRVREEYEAGCPLRGLADSTIDPEPMALAELISLLSKLREASAPGLSAGIVRQCVSSAGSAPAQRPRQAGVAGLARARVTRGGGSPPADG
jgi:hypothetical protein